MTSSHRALAALVVALVLLAGWPARADVEAPPPSPPVSPETSAAVDEQKAEIERQRALIEDQKKKIDAQAGDISALKQQLADMEQMLLSLKRRLDELEAAQTGQPGAQPQTAAAAAAAQQAQDQAEKEAASPEIPPDVVSAGDFPGSIRIPGTDAAVRFGALIRTAFVFTLKPLGSDDRFLTYSIPVGPPPAGDGPRTAFTANTSRFNVDFRTPTGIGQIRAFIEGDFTGTNNSFHLRHAYAQYRGFIVGQTWSTFSDPEAAPEDIDFEGVSSKNEIRQPQIRYSFPAGKTTRVAVAAETPSVSITGGQGVNQVPDVVAKAVFVPKQDAHIQVAGVFRQVRGQSDANPAVTQSVFGWGLSVSASWPFRRWRLTDTIVFQANGGVGVARYINDLNSMGGEDGVFDTNDDSLHALPVFGWYVAYQHMWRAWETTRKMNLRSSIIASWVYVNNFDFEVPTSYERTQRYAANVVFSPSPRIDVGVEYLWGKRVNLDGQSGWSDQVQAVGYFRF
jgi:hypothetical protein